MLYKDKYMKKSKKVTISLNAYNERYPVVNKSLYLGLLDKDGCSYADITICPAYDYPYIPPFHAFLNTYDLPDIRKFVEKYHLGKFTGKVGTFGLCTYPLYRFDPEKLKKLCPNEFKEFFGRNYEELKHTYKVCFS